MLTRERNWAGNYTYRAEAIHQPRSIDELREIVARAPRIRALGSRHCFNDIADSDVLMSLEALAGELEIDREARTVTVGGGMRYGDLAQSLVREGLALHNMASLPHISVAGSIATATHGSGDANRNLATAVVALELVTSDGEVITVSRGDDDFPGMVVNLGALGVVTRVTLDVQPAYQVRQEVFEHLAWDVFYQRFDDVMSSAYSVSVFLDYGETVGSVWRKSRVDADHPEPLADEFLGARAATRHRHPMETMSGENCTAQLGVPGLWADRLPHFRMDARPASGDEIQAEYMVPRRFAVPALEALRALASVIRPHLLITEVRTVAADDLWLSSAYGTDTVCLHFSWKPDQDGVNQVLPIVERTLAPFEARPHFGKEFRMGAQELEARYPKLPEFRRLAERLDPRGAFQNAFLERTIFG
ncbi:MAG: xylitol oxidase() [uncultured Thermomicrobiales bacterium]|uniref:Xylitol oxidase( ) n=1 Tax=uncultured Thermomicrobiales bacterium TaxID=1645740 RepID=A0A6J4UR45_9BACT|nr:MAG: xylitol oxidase() [uncultured Thermomicrobiales bacterium]